MIAALLATRWRRWLWLGIAIGCVLLFVREPGPEQHRLWRQIWDLGHFGLFFLVGLIASAFLAPPKPWLQFVSALVTTALVGWLIELLQLAVGRDYSLMDVATDVLGMAAGLTIGAYDLLRSSRRLYVVVLLALVAITAERVKPALCSAVDAVAAWQSFPVLADFEHGFMPALQRDRFIARTAKFSIVPNALRIDLKPGAYPGFELDDFPNDWRGWRRLIIELDNPDHSAFTVVCRINDAMHEKLGNAWNDRFNRRFELVPGVNELRIDLAEVERAPVSRHMDMADIRSPMCFVMGLKQPRTLLLHSISLE